MSIVAQFLEEEYLPCIAEFMKETGIEEQYSHWLDVRTKLTQERVFLGATEKVIYVGKIEVNIRVAEFLDRQFQEAVPNLERYMDGEGVYYNYIVYPTHQVKPFKICFKCGRKDLDPANPGYFFCRRYTFTLCYGCGVVEIKKRQDPKACPPYKVYLYFKWKGDDRSDEADTWLQIMPQEDYVPMLREQKHNITCSICDVPNFVGIRYKCAVCESLDSCEKCFNKCFDLDKKKSFESVDKFKQKGCEGPKSHVLLAIYFNQAY